MPDDQNSALIIEALKDQLHELGKGVDPDILYLGSSTHGDFFTGIPKNRLEKSREFLATQSEVLDKLSAIRDMPTGRFAIAYDKDDPISTMLPNLEHVRKAAKLFRLQGAVAASEKDIAGALNAFELQCRTAGSLGDEPILIRKLVQIAVQALVIQTAEEILFAGGLDTPSLERIAAELMSIRDSAPMRWGFLGERAYFTDMCEGLLNGTIMDHEICSVSGNCNTFPGNFFRLPTYIIRSNQLEGASLFTTIIETSGDAKAMLVAARKMEQRLNELSGTYKIIKILIPSLSRTVLLNVKLQAQTECALAALAAEEFRLAQGRLPDSLEELVPVYLPAVPTDPFDGKPMRLAKTEKGIVIYSVDEDTIDNGGDVARKSGQKSKRATDTSFRLNHPDHRGVVIVEGPADSED